MRTIKKLSTPAKLDAWRADREEKNDDIAWPYDYDAMRRSKEVLEEVEDSLHAEQGGICAYTGRGIPRCGSYEQAGFHIEHVKAQDHCRRGEDTDYGNLVACWPPPNQKQATEYGAVEKKKWPSPEEATLFVSPLHEGCSARFAFINREDPEDSGKDARYSNWIEPSSEGDAAAAETIKRINLNHHELRALRWDAVMGSLNPNEEGFLPLNKLAEVAGKMDKAEESLDAGGDVTLDPFCFAVRQAIARRIQKLHERRKPE